MTMVRKKGKAICGKCNGVYEYKDAKVITKLIYGTYEVQRRVCPYCGNEGATPADWYNYMSRKTEKFND